MASGVEHRGGLRPPRSSDVRTDELRPFPGSGGGGRPRGPGTWKSIRHDEDVEMTPRPFVPLRQAFKRCGEDISPGRGVAVHFILQAMCFFHMGDSKKTKGKKECMDGWGDGGVQQIICWYNLII